MKIEVLGAAHAPLRSDILAFIDSRGLTLVAIEVAAKAIFIEVNGLDEMSFGTFARELLALPDVQSVRQVALLPHECQRMQFEALLSSLAEPLLAVDMSARVILANGAAERSFGIAANELADLPTMVDLFGSETGRCLTDRLSSCTGGEVMIAGQPYLVDVLPVLANKEDPVEIAHGAVLVFRSIASLGQEIYAIEKRGTDNGLIGSSDAMQKVSKLISRFAPLSAPVLITGETGTGKELVARACHRLSQRSTKAFLALNCAALPENLAESELFGYAAGAFSGAQRNGKPGLFELANGGTVFLDEIGEMSAYLQAKLLRVLQDGSFLRIGSKAETRVDVRILAATHRNLPEMVQGGSFREDLFFRLNVLSIELPALRERREDIPELVNLFSARAAAQVGTTFQNVTEDALDCLCQYDWPGNVREMENILFRSMTLSDTGIIGMEDLPQGLQILRGCSLVDSGKGHASHVGTDSRSYSERLHQTERDLLLDLYQKYPSTRKLANELGMSHTAVAKKLRKFGISR